MPELRAFRALRYVVPPTGDLTALICPPYDVIAPMARAAFHARSPHNAVHLELPEPAPEGDSAPYRDAARQLVAWRSNGTLRKDPRPAIYTYEQRYRMPGSARDTVTRGFFARVRLEPFSPEAGIRPHERTMSGPKEDRYRLLKATGANLSPVVGLYEDGSSASAGDLDALTAGEPDGYAADDDRVRHRLWVRPIDDPETGPRVERLLARLAACPITIADGHHRYETALRYREERGRHRACESDPAYDFVLMLLQDVAGTKLTVLPTHRVVRGSPAAEELLEALGELFHVEPVGDPAALLERLHRAAPETGNEYGTGRIGVWTAGGGALLRANRAALEPMLPPGSPQVRGLDVTILAAALRRTHGIEAADLAGGGRLRYVKEAAEAVASVSARDGDAAFLLDPTPVRAVLAVAAAGDVMPQKSTYFYPKAATGLLFNPLEP